ncbi:class II poly(R)-hydroxyalkanoic acid synthase [Pseudomonas chlororaphis]|uniref:Class II poly(R)-hydroxyalkanoic acid synthase n=1 Tax=Pseudomonas chlororaphis TaxID=587753 RepID=A0A1Q8EN29_9PSED|nr:class II poly(R)-hydroxyalkanoic acid synthase [Pseudomonas chlororaphis]OLF53206.1 class II poly(R)-hydroxyalkanoic acid synthase [Pseudomonas chlororaphis]
MDKNDKELSLQAAKYTLSLNPAFGPRGRDVLGSARMVLQHVLRQPAHSARHMAAFGVELTNILLDRSALKPAAGDKRFDDPTWQHNPFYRRYMKAYLAWSRELNDWISSSNLCEQDAARGQFVIDLLAGALAPTNTPANPAALKRFFETGGRSALKGASHLVKDLIENGGMPSQVDKSAFEVGRNLGTTEGAVVFRNEWLELIQYTPRTEQVLERPLLVVPPQINKFYLFDLAPQKSLIRYLLDSGVQVFAVSWRNPGKAQREWGLSSYVEALKEAVDAVLAITGSADLNTFGACSGGSTMSSLLGHYAALGETKVNAFTLGVSMLDIRPDTQVSLFADEKTLEEVKRRSYQAGVLEGRELAKVFAWMRPNDLIWNYWVNNYLLGNEPPAFDVLYWNNDTTNLPAALHGEFIEMYQTNPLARAGALEVCGTPIDLGQVTSDFYCMAGLTDHITPWDTCYRSMHLFGGQGEFVLSNSGHIQSILNPPDNPKARFMTGSSLPEEAQAWLESSSEHSGSWWGHWQSWLQARSGKGKKAPGKLGNKAYPAAEASPGTYVHRR